ncbi:unnamed protein product [Prorocentrum cordatum]|uniref:Protein S-acyltransferase n=1 Tax=Prorocentrum cordatum TaxID=2364126 RepID=A0ABN9US94_9DINO|nr:unnamed protein product [Polarella glacialis]
MGPAVTAHLPLGRVHVDVPMSRGEHAQWPRTAVPTQALEAAAQDWYEYRDGSCLVAAWNSYQGISLATALCFAAAALAMLAGGPAAGTCRASPLRELCPDSGDAGKEGMVYSIIVALNIVGLAYVVFSCYFTHAVVPRLRGEVSCRLAAPLSRALASASWSVEAHMRSSRWWRRLSWARGARRGSTCCLRARLRVATMGPEGDEGADPQGPLRSSWQTTTRRDGCRTVHVLHPRMDMVGLRAPLRASPGRGPRAEQNGQA